MKSITAISRRISFRPYCYLSPSIATSAVGMLFLLLPQVLMLLLTGSFNSAFIVSLTVLAAILADLLHSFFSPHFERSWCVALVQGIIIGLLLPSTYSPVAAFIITFCTLMLSKYAFGGFSSAWVNPAAITVAVAYFLDMTAFSIFQLDSSLLQTRNAALSLIQEGAVRVNSFDAAVTAFLNKSVFSIFSLAIPEGYVSLFWDTCSIIPAFRFNFITIVSSIVLISLDIIDWVIPTCFVLTYATLVRLVGPLVTGGLALQGDMLLALLTSGTLFSTLYVIQWYGTTPLTPGGKCIYGVIAGLLAFLIIGIGNSAVGYIFVVLAMNILSPVIQAAENRAVQATLKKSLMPRLDALKEVDNV